ncbi:MAG TPA: choice-of-anchor Q domain-containing protein [Verrucomicrobiae bacterium]
MNAAFAIDPRRALSRPIPVNASIQVRLKAAIALLVFSVAGLALSSTGFAAIRYVNVDNVNPGYPFDTWETAATSIQDAVDAAYSGEEIVVTNGIYATGGRAITGPMINRVAVTKPLLVRSVNGPAVTIIQGNQVQGTTNGPGAVRCVYLASNATLSGFTLRGGATLVSEDWIGEGSGGGVWGESSSAVVTDCVLEGNSAYYYGGGAYWAYLKNCTVRGNSAIIGGGAYYSTLSGCVVTRNSAVRGGATVDVTLYNCTVTGNFARDVGGVAGSGIINSIVYFNKDARGPAGYPNYGGCYITNSCTAPAKTNTGSISADPQLASASHLSAGSPCRGAGSFYFRTGNDLDGELWGWPPSIGCDEYIPGAVSGPLEVALEASDTRIAPGFEADFTALIEGRTSSSVWDFGDGTAVSNRPYTSHAWVSAGLYQVVLTAFNESHPSGVSATATVAVVTAPVHYVALGNPRAAPPYSSWQTAAADIQSAIDGSTVAGALVLVSNGVYNTGGRVVYGSMTNRVVVDKPVVVRSVNGPGQTIISGFQPVSTNGDGAIRCVFLGSRAVLSGFTLANGGTRDTAGLGDNDKEQSGGGVWCATGETVVTNCIIAGNSAAGGGGGAFQGWLTNCTLVNNWAWGNGGGSFGCTVGGCVVASNTASGYYGGGVYGGRVSRSTLKWNTAASEGGAAYFTVLDNCLLLGNLAKSGGGAYLATLNNCTLVKNSAVGATGGASNGGGATDCTLNNSILYYNYGLALSNNYWRSTLNYCCTVPLATNGVGNFTDPPRFVDLDSGNLQLLSNSPCINAGSNSYVTSNTDLDGSLRIVGGIVDVGAYEYQGTPTDQLRAWLASYGLATDGSQDYTDPDGDGMNNWQEWVCGTDPTNGQSVLKLTAVTPVASGMNITWQSVASRTYFLEKCTPLWIPSGFIPCVSNVVGQAETTTFIDTNAAAFPSLLYRVGIQ